MYYRIISININTHLVHTNITLKVIKCKYIILYFTTAYCNRCNIAENVYHV